jgi:hypothetical protein
VNHCDNRSYDDIIVYLRRLLLVKIYGLMSADDIILEYYITNNTKRSTKRIHDLCFHFHMKA